MSVDYLKHSASIKGRYQERKLDDALSLSVDYFEQVLTENKDKSTIAQAGIQLAQIYYTKGVYSGENIWIQKAIETLDSCQLIVENLANQQVKLSYYLIAIQSYALMDQDQNAQAYREKAIELVKDTNTPSATVQLQILLCKEAIEANDFDMAFDLVQKGISTVESASVSTLEYEKATLYNLLGRIQIMRQDIVETLKISQVALKISQERKDIENELIALNNLAIVHGIQSEYKEAMTYLMQGLEISTAIKYRQQIARCRINMGSIYAHLFNYKAALEHYKDVANEYDDVIERSAQIVLLNNIGTIHLDIHQNEEAIEYFEKAFQLASDSNYKELKALNASQLGRGFYHLGDNKRALTNAHIAAEIFDQLGKVNGIQLNLLNLGLIAHSEKDYASANKYLSQCVVASKTLKDDLTEIRAYRALSETYEAQDNIQQALTYLQIYTSYKSEYSKLQRSRQLLDLEIRYGIQHKQREIERLQTENELQALLLAQKDQIEAKNQELEEVNQELKRFASIVSHDLKEPLRMIGSFAKLIGRDKNTTLSTASIEYFKYVEDGVERMGKILSALMYYATIGKEGEPTKEIDLNTIVEICALHLRVATAESNATIKYENLPKIHSKNSLLVQLFQNLLSNAIKFRKPDQAPAITVFAKEQKDVVQIAVQDNGIGIEAQHMAKIFDIFQRLHAKDVYEGTGVGLAVCLKIAKRLGGRIWVESEAEKGSTFWVELPKTLVEI